MYIQRISKFCEKLKEKKGFQYSVIFVIIISSLAIGVKTYTLNPALLNLLIFADAAITAIFLLEIIIFLKLNLDLQIPVITSEEILPVPINPSFIGI